jgi:hypothetical protein
LAEFAMVETVLKFTLIICRTTLQLYPYSANTSYKYSLPSRESWWFEVKINFSFLFSISLRNIYYIARSTESHLVSSMFRL